jgi:hypothetical protein
VGASLALIDTIATARRDHEGLRLSTRWNARARRERAALGRAEEALLSGERIAIYTRSMPRALVDGSGNAHPMPTLSAMLATTASATGAYTAWGPPPTRQPTVRPFRPGVLVTTSTSPARGRITRHRAGRARPGWS